MTGMADPQIPIQLPLAFDLGDIRFRSSRALVAVRRQYDYVGVFALAFVTGLGGALIRDGVFLASGPPMAVRDSRYLLAVLAATLVALAIDQLNAPLDAALSSCSTRSGWVCTRSSALTARSRQVSAISARCWLEL